MAKWKPIDQTTPMGKPHLRGLWVHSGSTGKAVYWEAHHGHIDEDGEFVTPGGEPYIWAATDYTHWLDVPEPPRKTATLRVIPRSVKEEQNDES